jgi:Cdc6-like AAA superfamily ATPase
VTERPLHDPVVQRAVSGVQLRSERQEDIEQLVSTFVDPGISVQLQNDNNQILYGRRGTGKTHVLKVVQAAAGANAQTLALYIDMRTLGSSSGCGHGSSPTTPER